MKPDTPCQAWLEAISCYLDGVLDAAEEHRVHAHLRRCPACAEFLVDLVPVVRTLHCLPAPAPGCDPWAAIAAELAADPAFAGRRWRLIRFPRPMVGWAAAGVVAVVVGAAGWQILMPAAQPAVADTDMYWHQHQLFSHEEGVPTLYAPELSAIEASYHLDD